MLFRSGAFRDDKRNGRGTLTLADGSKYEGEFRDDKRTGRGSLTFQDGAKYVGEFRDGKFNGRGTYTFPSGTVYVGEFKDDNFNGLGTLTYADGSKYVGEFRDDKRHGGGSSYSVDGKETTGFWSDGEYIGTKPPEKYPAAPTNRIRMTWSEGAFKVPVRLNDQLTLNFAVDSGAADVSVPADVVATLMRTATIAESDFLGDQIYVLADGKRVKSRRFILREMTVGNQTVRNVEASVADLSGSLKLRQSFLRRFKLWSIDDRSREIGRAHV